MTLVQNFEIFAPKLIDRKEYFSPGHRACQGCGEVLALRIILKALGDDVVISNATGCMEIISSAYPQTAWEVPYIHVAFENAAAVGSGVEAALKALRRKGRIPDREVKSVAIAGDGGTCDIGLQALSGAMERGHDLMFICLDNEAYMNTGIQRSSSTPYGASTTTSPAGKKSIGQHTQKKNMVEICAAHGIPYVATACPSFPFDLLEKVKKASETPGPAYIHILSVCPTGWRIQPADAIKYGRLAVNSCVFPLYEVVDGKHRLTYKPSEKKLIPVSEYLGGQGRFRHLTDKDIEQIQAATTRTYERLLRLSEQE